MTYDLAPTCERVPDAARIAAQNDAFRHALPFRVPGTAELDGLRGRVLFTQAVAARGSLFGVQCLLAVAAHRTFDPENDPNGWHDFGAVEVEGTRVWFKIDLYDAGDMTHGSEAPGDPARTYRVLTVLFPSDW